METTHETSVVLWNDGEQSVRSLGDVLQLDSGTLSPLLKRMEEAGLIGRERRTGDERVVYVTLTERAVALRAELSHIPSRIAAGTGLGVRNRVPHCCTLSST